MSRRTLGGGRVLGSGKSLSPAPPPTQKLPSPLPPHVQSPAASNASLNSGSGASTPPSSEQDIISRISLDHGDVLVSATAMAGDRMVCPICNEEMVTLLQLNRHLDDAHKEIEEERQDEVKDWFKSQMVKAKKFQPLAVLNQKLKGLDVFESNNDISPARTPVRRGSDPNSTAPPMATPVPPARSPLPDPDEVVSKEHWQRRGAHDLCSEPACGKRLTTSNGSVNCRHCGKLFCDEHTMYQMKLSRSAQPEPVRGLWCRVCETCYKSREGYNDRTGLERNHSTDFYKLRSQTLDKTYLEVSRLEKRLTRLTQMLANPPDNLEPPASKRWTLASWTQNDPRKAIEQSVVVWQEDASVARCPYCQQDFTQYTFRRHHCRTCGKVVCGDPATGCSTMLGLNVASTDIRSEKLSGQPLALDVRLCKDCNHTLFSRRDFDLETTSIPPTVRAYHNLTQFEHGIRLLLPRFTALLTALQNPNTPPTSQQIADASKVRKRLIDSFTQYDIAARRIRDMPVNSATQAKLQKSIYQYASGFLHLHMLPLKTLPKILKHATPHGNARVHVNGSPSRMKNGSAIGRPSALASINYASRSLDSASQVSSAPSSQISALEAEEKQLRERLIVLEEQKFFVSEMLTDANKRRKFDEVEALKSNVEDLNREIDGVTGLLSGLGKDFEAVYAGIGNGVGFGSGAGDFELRPEGKG